MAGEAEGMNDDERVRVLMDILIETKRAFADPAYRCVETEPFDVCQTYCRCDALDELERLRAEKQKAGR